MSNGDMADTQARLESLLLAWQEAFDAGRDLPADPEHFPDCTPELLADFQAQVRALRHVIALAETGPTQPASASSAIDADDPVVPGYEVLGVLGKGGMGVVYRARHLALDRVVALKMVRSGGHSEEGTRLLAEAAAIARVRHPGIVQVYDYGNHRGDPYFSLEMCEGGSLADRLRDSPLPPREAAAMLEQVARAVQAAHEAGVIHRDLKPANVLLGGDGRPRVADFGLAKRADTAGHTRTGTVMGTPSFMAPEQARGGKDVGTAADVYALGAVLYVCLSGRPPFQAATDLETVLQVIDEEPVPLRQLVPSVPKDLETICHKCLDKDPRRRYASAGELAEDCHAFLERRPIRARPVGLAERAWRWCRRNPAVASLLTLAAGSLLSGAAVAGHFALRAEAAREAESRRAESESAAKREAEEARRLTQLRLADLCVTSGLAAADAGEHSQALLWFAHAVRHSASDPEREEVNRVRVTNWRRHVIRPVWRSDGVRLASSGDRFRVVAAHAKGGHVLTVTDAGRADLDDLTTGKAGRLPGGPRKLACAGWSSDGTTLAVAPAAGGVELYSFPKGELLWRRDTSAPADVLAFSPDGKRLAWGGRGGARVLDTASGDPLTGTLAHPAAVEALTFSPSGGKLATAAADRRARVFDVPSRGKDVPLFGPVPHETSYFPNSQRKPDAIAPRFVGEEELLTVRSDTLQWRSTADGKLRRTSPPVPFWHSIRATASAPTGRVVVSLWNHGARVFNLDNESELGHLPYFHNSVEQAVFSADGQTLYTAGQDAYVRAWSVTPYRIPALEPAHHPLPHPVAVTRIAVASAAPVLISAQADGEVRAWRLPSDEEDKAIGFQGATRFEVHRDGRHVLTCATSHKNQWALAAEVHDAATGRLAAPPMRPGGLVLDATFTPDGRRVLIAAAAAADQPGRWRSMFKPGGEAGGVSGWDWRKGRRLFGPVPTPSEPRGLAVRPDGRLAAVTCADGQLVLFDPATGEVQRRLDSGVRDRGSMPNFLTTNGLARFSSDGSRLLTWQRAPEVLVWDPSVGTIVHRLRHDTMVLQVQFHPGRPLALTTTLGGVARVWDLKSGQPAGPPLSHPEWIPAARFSPDGRTVLTGAGDGVLRVWDWERGGLLSGRRHRPLALHDLDVTPDGRWLLSGAVGGWRVTHLPSAQPVTPGYGWPHTTLSVRAVPATGRAYLGKFEGYFLSLDLAGRTSPAQSSAADLILEAEVISGLRLDDAGQPQTLTAGEWRARWEGWQRAGR